MTVWDENVILDTDEVKANFKPESYRGGQEESLEEIVEAINSGYKIILLDCPTGGGKSIINSAVAFSFGNSYYITPQNKLIDQIRKDRFLSEEYEAVKGRQNYTCENGLGSANMSPSLRDNDWNVAKKGPCCQYGAFKKAMVEGVAWRNRTAKESGKYIPVTEEWALSNTCEYPKRVYHAMTAKNLLTNFWYFVYAPHFDDNSRDILVIDEAHDIANVIRDKAEVKITKRGMSRAFNRIAREAWEDKSTGDKEFPELTVPVFDREKGKVLSVEEVMSWLDKELLPAVEDVGSCLSAISKRSEDQQRTLNRLSTLSRKIAMIQKYGGEENAIVGPPTDNDNGDYSREGFRIRPERVDEIFLEEVAKKADHIILSSATMFTKKVTKLGIDEEHIYRVSLGNNIPIENRAIHFFPVADMSRKETKRTKGKNITAVADVTRRFAAKHDEEKGMIHTVSFKRTKKFLNHLLTGDDKEVDEMEERIIAYADRKEDGDEKYQEFMDADYPAILISPAHSQGIDPKDDHARFNILPKIPFPNLSDEIWRARNFDESCLEAFKELAQMAGRGPRGPDDYCVTYLFDESFYTMRKGLFNGDNTIQRETKNHYIFDQTIWHGEKGDTGITVADWLQKAPDRTDEILGWIQDNAEKLGLKEQ